jgi:hypothetical protein
MMGVFGLGGVIRCATPPLFLPSIHSSFLPPSFPFNSIIRGALTIIPLEQNVDVITEENNASYPFKFVLSFSFSFSVDR